MRHNFLITVKCSLEFSLLLPIELSIFNFGIANAVTIVERVMITLERETKERADTKNEAKKIKSDSNIEKMNNRMLPFIAFWVHQ